MFGRKATRNGSGVGGIALAAVFVLAAISSASFANTSAVAIVANPLANSEVLEPSVANEVEHAIERGEQALLDSASEANASIEGMLPGGLSTTDQVLRLVSAQRGDGKWFFGTNDVTFTVLKRLRRLKGEDRDLPTGCPEFEVEMPRVRKAVVVRAADYGFSVTNDHNAEAINAALEAAKRQNASRIELAAGEYRCFDGGGVVIDGFEDFTFDGKGAILVFRRDHAPLERQDTLLDGEANVVIRNCNRCEIGNFNIDWDWQNDPLAFWCKCVGKQVAKEDNCSYADFELDAPHPKYPNPVPIQLLTPMAEDHRGARKVTGRGPRCYFGMCLGHQGAKMQWLSPSRIRIWPYVKPQTGFLAKENENRYTARGNRNAVSGLDIGGTFSVAHRYYGMNGIGMDSNRHLTVKDVDIWACWGLGVETRGSQQYWQLVNVNVRSRPGKRYPVTATADAHHVVQSRGFGKMIGCETTMNQDDHFNFHDRTQIACKRGVRKLEVVNNRGVGYTLFRKGTLLSLRNDDFSPTGWEGRIVEINGEEITFDRDLPEQKGMLFIMIDSEYATENFLIKDCRFHDSPWSRGICQGNNFTVEGCTFGPMTGCPLTIASCYTMTAWCEGIGATNIVVRNCRFENCLDNGSDTNGNSQIHARLRLPGKKYWPLSYIPIAHSEFAKVIEKVRASDSWPKPYLGAIGSILIEDNVFVNPRGYIFNATDCGECILRDNRVIRNAEAIGTLPYSGKTNEEKRQGSVTLKNCWMILPGHRVGKGDLTVENGRIAAIVERECRPDRLIMPGLVNCHGHTAMTLLRGIGGGLPLKRWLTEAIFPIEAKMKAEDIQAGVNWGIMEMLAGGTTRIADMYDFQETAGCAYEKSGIKANICCPGVSLTPGKLARCVDFVRKWKNGRAVADFCLHSEYLTDEAFCRGIAEANRELKRPVHVHVSETLTEHEDCIARHGKTPIAYFADLGVLDYGAYAAHCVHCTDDDFRIMREKNVTLVHNPSSNMKLGSGFARIPAAIAAGVNVALGTDGCASNDNLDMFEEMHLASLIHKGVARDPTVLPAWTVIDMATINGAKALGDRDSGELKVGKAADLCVVDMQKLHLSPAIDIPSLIVHSMHASDVEMTMVDGKVLYRRGQFTSIDRERAKLAFAESTERLLK